MTRMYIKNANGNKFLQNFPEQMGRKFRFYSGSPARSLPGRSSDRLHYTPFMNKRKKPQVPSENTTLPVSKSANAVAKSAKGEPLAYQPESKVYCHGFEKDQEESVGTQEQ